MNLMVRCLKWIKWWIHVYDLNDSSNSTWYNLFIRRVRRVNKILFTLNGLNISSSIVTLLFLLTQEHNTTMWLLFQFFEWVWWFGSNVQHPAKTPNLYTTLPNQVAMPPQVSNLRLLFFSPFPPLSLPPLKPSFSLFPKSKPYSLLTALASSSNHKRRRHIPYRSPNLGPRSKSTLRESRHRDKGMEDKTESVAFNKRRAEGNDKNERPKKNLQRKVRALNPTNTIAYVQVCKGFAFLGFP